MPEQIAADAPSYLNLLSLVGLVVMLALAFLMSSYKSRVNWRLVILGVLLQIALAAVFFNSQSWTFNREFSDFDSLVAACQAGQIDPTAVPDSVDEVAFAPLFTQLTEEKKSLEDVRLEFWKAPASISVPRYKNGIVFYWVESFFGVIKKSVDAGASFVFDIYPDPDDDPKTHQKAMLRSFAFGILPTVIFFASLMSVLYYLGVMQKLIRLIAWVMQKTLRTSPSESLAAAANVLSLIHI